MIDRLQIPPIRTRLDERTGQPVGLNAVTAGIAKEWYLFWSNSSDQINANRIKLDGLVTSGTDAERPPAETMPEGALYIESDRHVIYQNEGGKWIYVTGTMLGTLSPDQRPTGLGVNDTGFEFQATDTANAQRTFYWSGTAWIETTVLQYGTHAARPATSAAPRRSLYVETDRGNVIYQNQGSNWVYVAGIMLGTISPDQRPTGLGANDTGFRFEATDTGALFRWSGAAWVDITKVGGTANLTHANVVTKVSASGQITEGGITDLSAGNSSKVTITAAGSVGVGITPQAAFESNGMVRILSLGTVPTSSAGIEAYYSGGQGVVQVFDRTGGAFQQLRLVGSPVVINPGGQSVGIGVPGPSYQLQLSTDSAAKPTTSTWTVPSDIRAKQRIEPVTDDSLGILEALEWVRYEYTGQANTPEGRKGLGLIAQQIRAHLPEAVRSVKAKLNEDDAEETELLGIDYHHIFVHSARAIGQLAAEVKRLKTLIKEP